MLKNSFFVALLGIAVVGVPMNTYAKSSKTVSIQKNALSSISLKVNNQNIDIEFYAPSIVRVVKSDASNKAQLAKEKKSYSVILKPQQLKVISTQEHGDILTMKSADIIVNINKTTGEITFLSPDGKQLLKDTKTTLTARTDAANKGKYRVKQDFQLANDEAIYGLGQLRDTHMNQRGRHVELWNHNTYIAIPYFTSEKGYGLYWDNAGKTYFDDTLAENNKQATDGQDCTSFTSEV